MKRIASIDIFRALTMMLMIFVDDLWTLHDVPRWLDHAGAREDRMGLADVVFPAFLFIVGLSIPFALKGREKKARQDNQGRIKTKAAVFLHILGRSLALIVMGFFFVNHEYYRPDVDFFTRKIRLVFMVAAFFLIWNDYRTNRLLKVIPVRALQGLGVLTLGALAYFYKGGAVENPQGMSPHWWGILGLIGWAYLVCSSLYLLIGNRLSIAALFTAVFYVLNVQEFRPVAGVHGFKLIVGASNYALVMSGVLTTIIYLKLNRLKKEFFLPLALGVLGVSALWFGFATRPLWGISKIFATPSWTTICAGISLLTYALVYLVSDIANLTRWAGPLMPAGRSSLTCYLLPGLVYTLFSPQLMLLPYQLSGSTLGILKSFLFTCAIVFIVWILEKARIRIKL